MTTDQATALLTAEPRLVPYYGGSDLLQCTACRAYFSTGTAWKIHRRTGTCDTTRLRQDSVGVWQPPRRVRVKTHNTGTTPLSNPVTHATATSRLIDNPAARKKPP